MPRGLRIGHRAGVSLALNAGSFALTGSALALRIARKLGLAAGSFTLTGQDVALGDPTQLSDWIARSTASGVVQAKRFTSSGDLGNTTTGPLWPNGEQSYMAVATRGGIIGDGYLRKTIPITQGQTTAHLVWPLNSSWTSNSDNFGLGNKWYAQWRFIVGPTLIRDTANNGTGLKICNIGLYNFSSFTSSTSAPNNEIVVYINHGGTGGSLGRLNAYRYDPSGAGYDTFQGDASLLSAENQFYVPEMEWIDVQIEVTIATLGASTGSSPGNTFTLKAKRAYEADWTTVFDAANFGIGNDSLHTAFWDTGGYDTGRKASTDGGYDTGDPNFPSWWGMDQLIVSTSSIAAPLPKYTVPSWFTSASNSTFGVVPGTDTGTIQAVQQGGLSSPESIVTAWNSPILDLERMELRLGGAGGHGDYGGNEFYACPLTGTTNAWRRLNDYTSPPGTTAAQQVLNGTNATSSGAMATYHTYGMVDWFEGQVYFTGGSANFSTGDPSSAIWTWAEEDLANGENGYTYHGKGAPSWTSNAYDPILFDAWNVVDPVQRDIWTIPQAASGGSSNPGAYKINHDTKTITTYTFSTPYGHFPGWVVCVPRLNILLCCGDSSYSLSPGLWYLNLSNPTAGWTEITTTSGTLQGRLADAAVFHATAGSYGKVYIYRGGSTLYTLTLPLDLSGTFTFGSTTLSGTAPSAPTNGWYKKMRLAEHYSSQAMLVFLTAYDAGLKYVKVPSGGF